MKSTAARTICRAAFRRGTASFTNVRYNPRLSIPRVGSSPVFPRLFTSTTALRQHAQDATSRKLDDIIDNTRRGSTNKQISIPIDGEFVPLDTMFLRDACGCPRCVDPSTRQKLFATHDISLELKVQSFKLNRHDGSLDVIWARDHTGTEHRSHYSLSELNSLASVRYNMRNNYNDVNYVLWDRDTMERDVHFIPYEDYMHQDEVLLFALQQLMSHGLVFIKRVPGDPAAIEGLAERIGNIKQTFYGKTWDVRSVADSKNIAYTSLDLGLHMDLLYFESPPGIQLLHCIKNGVTGGSSYFADSYRAAEMIRMNSPNAFSSLSTFPVTFHYKNDGKHYYFKRPTIVLDNYGYTQRKRIAHINYAPPFQGPFEIPEGDENAQRSAWRQFLHAFRLFAEQIANPQNQFELRLNEGECVLFQNRRTLHARREFDATEGVRWLKGTYVDGDAFRSKFRVLSEKFRKTKEEVRADQGPSYVR